MVTIPKRRRPGNSSSTEVCSLILDETERRRPMIMAQAIVSVTSPNTSNRHGKYSGTNKKRISQTSGTPYHIAPTSTEGVFAGGRGVLRTRPVKRVISSPPTTEKITILFAFKRFHDCGVDYHGEGVFKAVLRGSDGGNVCVGIMVRAS